MHGAGKLQKTGAYLPLRTEAAIFETLRVEYREPWEREDKNAVVSLETGRPWLERNEADAADAIGLPSPRPHTLPAPRSEG
jgi:hypothetical protein